MRRPRRRALLVAGVGRPGPQHQPARRSHGAERARDGNAHSRSGGRILARASLDLGSQPSRDVRRLESGGQLPLGARAASSTSSLTLTKTVGNELRRQRIPLSALPPTRAALSHRLDTHVDGPPAAVPAISDRSIIVEWVSGMALLGAVGGRGGLKRAPFGNATRLSESPGTPQGRSTSPSRRRGS